MIQENHNLQPYSEKVNSILWVRCTIYISTFLCSHNCNIWAGQQRVTRCHICTCFKRLQRDRYY